MSIISEIAIRSREASFFLANAGTGKKNKVLRISPFLLLKTAGK